MNQEPDFSQMTRREIEDYLVERAMVEPDFRRRLIGDAAAVLREIGIPIGPDVKIRVLEEEEKSFFIVIPRVLRELQELDESDLGEVSGGTSGSDLFFKGYS